MRSPPSTRQSPAAISVHANSARPCLWHDLAQIRLFVPAGKLLHYPCMGLGPLPFAEAQGGSPTQSRTSARQRRRPSSHGRPWPDRPRLPSRGSCGLSFTATVYIFVALPTPRMSPRGQLRWRLVAVPVAVGGVCTRSSRRPSRADRPGEGGRHWVNNDRQTWKACWVHALAGSNPASSAA